MIPPNVRARVSVEAGVAQGWREVVGDAGRMVSLEHFGASADYDTIYRQFHITAEAVTLAAEESLRALEATTEEELLLQLACDSCRINDDRDADFQVTPQMLLGGDVG